MWALGSRCSDSRASDGQPAESQQAGLGPERPLIAWEKTHPSNAGADLCGIHDSSTRTMTRPETSEQRHRTWQGARDRCRAASIGRPRLTVPMDQGQGAAQIAERRPLRRSSLWRLGGRRQSSTSTSVNPKHPCPDSLPFHVHRGSSICFPHLPIGGVACGHCKVPSGADMSTHRSLLVFDDARRPLPEGLVCMTSSSAVGCESLQVRGALEAWTGARLIAPLSVPNRDFVRSSKGISDATGRHGREAPRLAETNDYLATRGVN